MNQGEIYAFTLPCYLFCAVLWKTNNEYFDCGLVCISVSINQLVNSYNLKNNKKETQIKVQDCP